MAIPKTQIGAGLLICAVVLSLFWILGKPRPSIVLPDGSRIRFDAVATKAGAFDYDDGFNLALRRSLPQKWCHWLGIRRHSSVNFILRSGNAERFTEIGLVWTGTVNSNLFQFSSTRNFLEIIDENRSFVSKPLFFDNRRSERIVNAAFASPTFLGDEVVLRLVSGNPDNTNDWIILGEMRVKNPIPMDKRF